MITIANQKQPQPGGADIASLVISDIEDRARIGQSIHGKRLTAWNGSNALLGAYQACLDTALYLRQCIEENEIYEDDLK